MIHSFSYCETVIIFLSGLSLRSLENFAVKVGWSERVGVLEFSEMRRLPKIGERVVAYEIEGLNLPMNYEN